MRGEQTAKVSRPSLAALKTLNCLKGLSEPLLGSIRLRSHVARFAKDSVLIQHLATTSEVYFLVAGQVRVNMLAASGRPITYQTLGAGSHFGEIAAVDGLPRSKSVSADSDVVTVCIEGKDFKALLDESAEFSNRVIEWLVDTTRWYSEKVFEYHTYNVKGRILAELLKHSVDPTSDVFSVEITDKDMASRVGTTRENVTRIYAKLRKKGVITREGHCVHVLSVRQMREQLQTSEFG